jgi:surface antigen Omp85-like protein
MRAIRPAPASWLVRALFVPAFLILLSFVPAFAQSEQQELGPELRELRLEGSTVFSRDDVVWLLDLTIGQRLPSSPEQMAELLQKEYEKEGYEAATVSAAYDEAARRLTLTVDEGRIDDVEVTGLPAERTERFRKELGIASGTVYNSRRVRERVSELLEKTGGAWRIASSGIDVVTRSGRRVVVVPIEVRRAAANWNVGSEEREDFFSPVDGFAPVLGVDVTRFDGERFRHTLVSGYVSYKFGREKPGYSLGVEQQLIENGRLVLGGELHDITASDDMWRLSAGEQSLVALAFKNTFRDYYRRRGFQAFAAVRPHDDHEIVASFRWDHHEPLANATDFSFFRDDHPFRPNEPILPSRPRALVLGYTWDSRGLPSRTGGIAYNRHLLDDLYGGSAREEFGARVTWTSEIAGHGLGGDVEFDRHILNARAYLPLGSRQSVAGRMLLGFSGGTVPIERRFALGGIGSVRGYAFKEARGEEMMLFNAEYRLDVLGRWRDGHPGVLRLILFFDAGRVRTPVAGSRTDWLRGTGIGLQTGPVRVEFGFRADDIPDSRQILVRVGPTF